MEFVAIILTLVAIAAIIAIAIIDGLEYSLFRASLGVLVFFIGVSIYIIIDKENTSKTNVNEKQPKYKQEIVYSLKDGKYLPTDTIYTEIK